MRTRIVRPWSSGHLNLKSVVSVDLGGAESRISDAWPVRSPGAGQLAGKQARPAEGGATEVSPRRPQEAMGSPGSAMNPQRETRGPRGAPGHQEGRKARRLQEHIRIPCSCCSELVHPDLFRCRSPDFAEHDRHALACDVPRYADDGCERWPNGVRWLLHHMHIRVLGQWGRSDSSELGSGSACRLVGCSCLQQHVRSHVRMHMSCSHTLASTEPTVATGQSSFQGSEEGC